MKKICLSISIVISIFYLSLIFGQASYGVGGFPRGNIRMVVPFAAGGGVDITCRTIAEIAGRDYFGGHSLIVENLPGGGAIVGQTAVARSIADGYTLLAASSSMVTNPLFNDTAFSTSDFKPIAMVCFDPQVLIVPKDSALRDLEDFFSYSLQKTVTVSTPGYTTAPHLAAMEMAMRFGLKLSYIHNDSSNVQLQQVMGSHVDCALVSAGEGASLIREGGVRALGVMSDSRIKSIPYVPTFEEMGYRMVSGAFRGLAVPRDTPDATVRYLSDEFGRLLSSEKFVAAMERANMPVVYRDSSNFGDYIEDYRRSIVELMPFLER